MTAKDYAAALDAAEKSLEQKERGKPLEPKLAPKAYAWQTNYTGDEWHVAREACFSSYDIERGIVMNVTPLYASPNCVEELRFELRAAKLELQIANEQIERLQDAARPKGGPDTPPPSHRVCLGNPRDLSGKPLGKTKHTDSDTLYFVGRLNGFAHAAMSGGMTDSPFGKTLREAAQHMERLADANGAMLNALLLAKETIKVWHGPTDWEIYERSSPEMKIINAAIAKAEGRAS